MSNTGSTLFNEAIYYTFLKPQTAMAMANICDLCNDKQILECFETVVIFSVS